MTGTNILPNPLGHFPLVHTCMSLKEVCVPLQDYEDSRELCSGIFDAMYGMSPSLVRPRHALVVAHVHVHSLVARWCVFTYAGIVHRDISDKNIMLYEDPKKPESPATGLLADWDLCRNADQLAQVPVQPNRSVCNLKFFPVALSSSFCCRVPGDSSLPRYLTTLSSLTSSLTTLNRSTTSCRCLLFASTHTTPGLE